MFNTKNVSFYLTSLAILVGASYIANNLKQRLEPNDEYQLIREYILNDSPLYGANKPKLWIHTEYATNSRQWKSFQSRNSNELNQPYLHITIQSIIKECGDHFHICLIDDDSFAKLVPEWKFDMDQVANPHKKHYRDVGLLSILYYYGGVVAPNSMICYENLKPLYDNCLTNKKACLGEQVNKSLDMMKQNSQPLFIPSIHFMAAPKQNEQVGLLKDYANQLFKSGHFTHEFEFSNRIGHKCLEMKRDQQINVLCGSYTGIKTNKGKPVLLDDLMEESMIDLRKDLYGIIIPRDELLLRTKHQWFAVLSEDEAIHTNACVSKLLFKAVHKHYQTFSVEKQSAMTL
uniref:Nucleotide-diphospho-sugar transferase domain-containing protein n=1 Tax=viral metagenome TaxID=1070528 RepID=A0A6C0AV72_9ZZZZ|tara:strand:+ start:15123 stop:16157 length:1035 start_codon:yes stop_codon:yes gene_type:complete